MHTGVVVSGSGSFYFSYMGNNGDSHPIGPITSVSIDFDDDDVENTKEIFDKPIEIGISMTKRKYKRLIAILRDKYKPYRKFKKGNRYVRNIY